MGVQVSPGGRGRGSGSSTRGLWEGPGLGALTPPPPSPAPALPRGGAGTQRAAKPAGGVSVVQRPEGGAQQTWEDGGRGLAAPQPFRLSRHVLGTGLGAEAAEQRETALSAGSLWSTETHTRQLNKGTR